MEEIIPCDDSVSVAAINAVLNVGAVAAGISHCRMVDEDDRRRYDSWIAEGKNAGMAYMERNCNLRSDPGLLLPGTQSVISCAFSFAQPEKNSFADDCGVAAYALGDDYHDTLRRRLSEAVQSLRTRFGGEYRICIDSAPVRERFWALKAGIAIRGDNGSVIVPGFGSMVFLAEILTTLSLQPCNSIAGDGVRMRDCGHCGACRRACPAKAIGENGIIDARRCLSYLTIEHKGEWDDNQREIARKAGFPIFGCDVCMKVCPHNSKLKPTAIKEFRQRNGYEGLTRDDIASMTQDTFSAVFRKSPVKRAGLVGLIRNLGTDNKT